jgi:hypothetical protein
MTTNGIWLFLDILLLHYSVGQMNCWETSPKKPVKGGSRATMEEFLTLANCFIPISTLIDVLSLAQASTTLHQLNNTGIISACVRLLKRYVQGHNVSCGFTCRTVTLISSSIEAV